MESSNFNLDFQLKYLNSLQNAQPTDNKTESTDPKIQLHQWVQKLSKELESANLNSFDLVIAAKVIDTIQAKQEIPDQIFGKIRSTINDKLGIVSKTEPNQVRESLIENGILPSSKEAKDLFTLLGENWWKQIIDGRHHEHGMWVFDFGLHLGPKEPGYLEGVFNACQFLVDHFDEKLNINLYRDIHHEACKHFKGEANKTLVDASQIDNFRKDKELCQGVVDSAELKPLQEELRPLDRCHGKLLLYEIYKENPESFFPGAEEGIKADMEDAQKWFIENVDPSYENKKEEIVKEVQRRVDDLKSKMDVLMEIEEKKLQNVCSLTAERLSISPYVSVTANRYLKFPNEFYKHPNSIHIIYLETDQSEKITEKLLLEFNANLEALQKECYDKIQALDNSSNKTNELIKIKAEYQKEAIPLIARLYAELEWAHPWIDGQGRTDLILLNGLLCREGLHPCILNEPYFSSFNTVEDWTEYLEKGLKEFEEQYLNNEK